MVSDVPRVELRLVIVTRRRLVVVRRSVTGRLAQVGVVEVQATHPDVVIGRLVHVRGPGYEAEREVYGTAA